MADRNKNVWVFNSANTFTGNPKWLFAYVNNHCPEISAYWICDSQETVNLVQGLGYKAVQFSTPEGNAVQREAGVFVVNQVKEHIATNLVGAVILNLWHGVGVKNIERGMSEGYLSEKIAKKYIQYNKTYKENQLFLVSSEMMEGHFKKQIGLNEHNIIRAGYPQNSYPKKYQKLSTFDHDILGHQGLPEDTRIAIFSPTPRRESTSTFLAQAFPDIPRLIKALDDSNTLLIIKMHPHMENDASFRLMRETYGNSKHLLFWNNSNDIYEIFNKVDLAVVDYSSILYDMLAAGVTNVIRYIYDYDNGNNPVLQDGMNYLEYSCGTIANSFDELISLLPGINRVDEDSLQKLDGLFWGYASLDDCESIIKQTLSFDPTPVNLPTLYSFDIFDTLIHRRGVMPVSVFHAVKDRMESDDVDFPRYLVDRFPEARQQAEAAVREDLRKREDRQSSGMLEIQFEAIYDKLSTTFDLSQDQCQALMAWEVEIELQDTIPNISMIGRVRELKNLGNDVVLISDMYLPETVIREMLAKADPFLAELPLYLSSTIGVQKSTKRLYLSVYRDLEYNYAKWVHTGDNAHADIKSAKALGIETIKRSTPVFDDYERNLVGQITNYDGYLLAAMLHGNRWGIKRTSHELFAFRHVALYLVPYVDWVITDALNRGYKTLYFVSRDGHHMKRICDALIQERGLHIRTAYIYGSRASWRFAAQIDDVDEAVFSSHGSFAGAANVTAIAKTVRLSLAELVRLVPELDSLKDISNLSKKQRSELLHLLKFSDPLRLHILSIGAQDRALVSRYLNETVDFNEEFALVEYWGRGYTQDCLVSIVEEMKGASVPVPFYYARSIYPTDGSSIRHNYTSANYSMLFMEAIFANLNHGTVEGFRESDAGVVPIVSPRRNDPVLHAALETGLVDFARLFAQTPFRDRDSLGRNAFRFGFEHFKAKPGNNIYVQRLGALKDSVELGAEEREFAPPFTLKDVTNTLRGVQPAHKTRSMAISVARTHKALKSVYLFERKHQVRGRLIAKARRLRRAISKLSNLLK